MKKVLIIGPDLLTGGVAKYVKDLLNFKGRYKYLLFNTARPAKKKITPGTGYIELFNSGIIRSILGIFVTFKNVIKFPLFLIIIRPNIVHICGVSFAMFWENIYYTLWSKLLGAKATIHYLGALDIYYEGAGRIEKRFIINALKLYDERIYLHSFVANMFKNKFYNNSCNVIYSNIDPENFANVGINRNNDKIKVLFMGGLDPFRKGINDIIKAIEIISKQNACIIFVFSGSDSFNVIRKDWEKKNISHLIQYVGTVSEEYKLELYDSSNILILPSYKEGLPYVIIEAMASGLPIVASSIGGIPEVVEHVKNGFIILPGDYEKLAEYILLLANNRELRNEMGRRNKEKATQFYSTKSAFQNLELIFDRIT